MLKKDSIILVDADVISHFITGNQISILPAIFEYKIMVIDIVYQELCGFSRNKAEIDELINQKKLTLLPFPEDNQDIVKEYFWIKGMMFKGAGESACMAVAKYTNNIIASSNLKDIKAYCERHSLPYITTMDFLCEALKNGQLSLKACNVFIDRVLRAGSKLPVKRMEDHECRELTFLH